MKYVMLWSVYQMLQQRKHRFPEIHELACKKLAIGWWFSLGTPVSFTNKTDHHDIHVTEILLKLALNIIAPLYIVLNLFSLLDVYQ